MRLAMHFYQNKHSYLNKDDSIVVVHLSNLHHWHTAVSVTILFGWSTCTIGLLPGVTRRPTRAHKGQMHTNG